MHVLFPRNSLEKTLTVRMARVAAAGKAVENGPKTNASSRTLPLDEGLAAVLRAARRRQAEERLALGAAYGDGDYVACDEAGRPYHPDTLSNDCPSSLAAPGCGTSTCTRRGTLRHHIAPPRRAVVRCRGVARLRRCERDGEDLCALPAGRPEGRLGDIGRSCDKHRDTHRNGGGNDIGSDLLRCRSEPILVARPKGFEPPTF